MAPRDALMERGDGQPQAETAGQGAAKPPRPRTDAADRGGHLGFVAHEIRNPLSTALWTAELLARLTPQDRGGARGEKLSAMCLRSIARVRQLIEDHFMCERLDAGGLTLRVEASALREVLDGVLARRPADAGPIEVDLDPSLAVDVDRAMLERALEGLIAVAGAERTPVTVSARPEQGAIVVLVSGRPSAEAALADPVKGAASDPTGRALALPLVRRIAEALGGALAAAEDGWRLSLPRARSVPPGSAPAAEP